MFHMNDHEFFEAISTDPLSVLAVINLKQLAFLKLILTCDVKSTLVRPISGEE